MQITKNSIDTATGAAKESTIPDLVELSRRSVGRINRGALAARAAQARGGEERAIVMNQ